MSAPREAWPPPDGNGTGADLPNRAPADFFQTRQPSHPSAEALAKQAPLFAVFCEKSDGRRYVFQRYTAQREAEAVASTLRRVGWLATVEVAR